MDSCYYGSRSNATADCVCDDGMGYDFSLFHEYVQPRWRHAPANAQEKKKR